MENLVLSIEQCRHLQELGLEMSDAKMCYHLCVGKFGCKKDRPVLLYRDELLENRMDKEDIVPTYTLQETLDNIPFEISDGKTRYELFIDYPHDTVFYYNFTTHKEYWSEQASSHRLIDSAYQMLVRYLTNK